MPTRKATRSKAPKTRVTPARKSRAAKPAAAAAVAAPSESRHERRKRDTRERLLNAAFKLMAERGMDAVAIDEITEAADVGFGSFYNHFESREAIYSTLMTSVFESF